MFLKHKIEEIIYSSNVEYNEFIKRNYFGSLNGIRAICALAVIKIHSNLDWLIAPKLLNQGDLGVDMFFTISGFLIVTLLIRERSAFSKINLKAFYIRRTLRIFPIYYLMIAIVFIFYLSISPWKPNGFNYYKYSFPVLLTYTQNIIVVNLGIFFHCWSLAMEEQFYLVWPSIEKFCTVSLRIAVVLFVLLVSQLCNFGYFKEWINHVYNSNNAYLMPMYLITFTPIILGVSLAYILNSRLGYKSFRYVLGGRASAIILFFILMILREIDSSQGLPRLIAHITIMFIVASLVIREDHFCSYFLKNKVLFYLGTISYGLYLYHIPILELIVAFCKKTGHAIAPTTLFILTSAITFFVAHFSYKYIERPAISLKKTLT